MRRLAKLLVISAAVLCAPSARAAADPAASVETFCSGIIDAVKAKGADAHARAGAMRPLVEKGFELPVVAQFAVGPPWSGMSAGDKAQVVSGLARYTAARYAKEFDRYTGQRCVVDRSVESRGPDRLVKTQVTEPGETTSVNYRLRQYGGTWKIIDVYFSGVSQLAVERADFAGVLKSSGPSGLTAKLNQLSAQMLGETH
jgi:phospholipid transport system substrate-binding protein